MSSRLRVLFVIPSLLRAGAQTQLVDLVNALDGGKFERHVYTFEPQIAQAQRLAPDVRFYNRPRAHRFDVGPAREMARIIDEERIDVVHCTMQFALLQGFLAARLSRRRPPFVDALHTTINRDRKDELLDRFLYQWLMRRASAVICVCDTQARVWREKFPFLERNAQVVHNGVDCVRFHPDSSVAEGKMLRRRLGIDEGDPVVASVAAFRPEKGHGLLLEAMAGIVEKFPRAQLLLAGDGPLRHMVERDVRTRGLTGNAHFLGSVEDVRPVLAGADLSLIASTAVETFSIAMLESLAMGVPVVTSDIGGSAEAVLDGRTGLVVPVGDAMALRAAIASLLEDPARRRSMGEQGRELVVQHFTQAAMAARTAALLERIAGHDESAPSTKGETDPRLARALRGSRGD